MDESTKADLATGIGKSAEKALDFIEKLIAGPFMEGTAIFTDKVKFWRFKNQINIITKAREFLKEKGIETPKKIPIKDLTTLLEYASFEQEDEMQDNWSRLLANTLDPKNEFDVSHIFSQVLNQLSVNEIWILQYIFSNSFIMSSDDRQYFERHLLIKVSKVPYSTGDILMDNLIRLKLIEEEPPKFKEYEKEQKSYYGYEEEPRFIIVQETVSTDKFRLSNFGVELVRQIKQ
ncbi:Abi-alpha family protein [Salinimicrobium sp. HB62]|uniref:Abi-alpha family protein n=1 Tax=Salinimicrobium sp. HB62 TaxID=3077781 RepID=UPI002D782075|nr:Abi-alpha family protein [Salinimicrobium sp. HB62]